MAEAGKSSYSQYGAKPGSQFDGDPLEKKKQVARQSTRLMMLRRSTGPFPTVFREVTNPEESRAAEQVLWHYVVEIEDPDEVPVG